MIITRLTGGLGNQLFQYAAGRRLATVLGADLKLDILSLGDPRHRIPRRYELAPFKAPQAFATTSEIDALVQPKSSLLIRLLSKIFYGSGRSSSSHVKERHYHFDPAITELPDNVYLDGYWQSERYFLDIADTIRMDFTLKSLPDDANQKILDDIESSNAISMHIRRGDYVADPVTRKAHGVLDLDYYRRAAAFIADRVSDLHFFVFSDDPVWAREYLNIPHPVSVVDQNGADRCHEDLRLMSGCKHHIIANSSFSWWGAWLNPSPDKIVVAPERWFDEYPADTRDLCPAGWVRL